MKYRLLDLLQCAEDGSPLQLENAQVKKVEFTEKLDRVKCTRFCGFKGGAIGDIDVSPNDCAECYSREVIQGELVSEAGKRYPIVDGIPRLLSARTADFIRKNKASFSLEWKYFRFGERNWGQGLEFRRELFLAALGVGPQALCGRTILDAGCGSGLLSIDMADSFGLEVIALDLATGIEQAYRTNRNPYVYFVQASLLEAPLKDGVADYIYCGGVLIHLPDTKKAFELLPRLLKTGGRYFVWVYRTVKSHEQKIDRIKETIYQWLRRTVTSRLPIRMQEWIYLCLALLFVIKRTVTNPFLKVKETRTWREKMQNLIDGFSPTYVNRHTESEVMDWYREKGLRNVAVAYRERYGFGVRGDLLHAAEESLIEA